MLDILVQLASWIGWENALFLAILSVIIVTVVTLLTKRNDEDRKMEAYYNENND